MGLNVAPGGVPLEFEAVINDDTLEVQIVQVTKKLQQAADAAVQSNKTQQQEILKTAEAYKTVIDSGSKTEQSIEGINDAAKKMWKTQQDSVNSLGDVFDKSAQDVKDYFDLIDQYNKDQINLPTNKRAPDGPKTTATQSMPDKIEGISPELLEESRKILNGMDDESKEFIKTITSLRQKLAENAAAQKALNKERNEGNIGAKQFREATTSLAAQEKVLQENIKEAVAAQKAYDAANTGTIGSINQKKAALVQLANEWNSLSEAERNMPEIGGRIAQEFAGIRKEVGQLTLEKFTQESEKSVSLLTQLRQLKKQIASTDPSDPQMKKLLADAGALQNKMDDVNQTIKTLGADSPGINAAIQGVRGLIGGFTALSGVYGLFSDNSKEVEKTIAQVTSAMAILNGVQEVAQVLDKAGALNQFLLYKLRSQNAVATAEQAAATTALAGATTAEAGASAVASGAMGTLNAVMAANPAGVLLLAITAIIVAFKAFADDAEEAAERQKVLNDTIAESNSLLFELIELQLKVNGDRLGQAERAVQLAQAQGQSEREILSLKIKAAEQSKADNAFRLRAAKLDAESIRNETIRLGYFENQLRTLLKIASADGDISEKEQKRIDLLKSKIDVQKSFLEPAKQAENAITDAEAQIAELRAEQRKKAYEDSLKSEVALSEARILQAQKDSAAELIAQKQLIQARMREELANVNLTTGEIAKIKAQAQKDLEEADRKFYVAQLQRQKDLIQAQLNQVREGSLEELNLRIEMLEKSSTIEIANAQDNAEKVKAIRSGLEKDINDLTEKFLADSAKSTLNTNISGLEERLAMVRENTNEELQLKLKLISEKAQLDIVSAQASIKNEEELAAKIKSITAQSFADRVKLEKDFQQRLIELRFKRIEDEERAANIQSQTVLEDPTASLERKQAAQTAILQQERKRVLQELAETEVALALKTGDTNKLLEKRQELYLALLAVMGKINNNAKKQVEEKLTDIITKSQKLSTVFGTLANSFQPVNKELAQGLQTIGNMIGMAANLKQALTEMKRVQQQNEEAKKAGQAGDLLGSISSTLGVVGAVAGIATAVVGIFNKAAERRRQHEKEVEAYYTRIFVGEQEINALYRERELSQIRINKLRLQGLQDEIALLQKQKTEISEQVTSVFAELQKQRYNPGPGIAGMTAILQGQNTLEGKSFKEIEELFLKGQLEGKAKELFELLKRLKEEGADVDKLLEQNKQQFQELLTGTTADNITDAIIQGLRDGKRAAEDFAGDFQDLMKGALLNAIKFKYLEGPIKQMFEQFATFADSDGTLTEAEIEQLKKAYNDAITSAGEKLKELQKITGIDLAATAGKDNTIAGAFRTMTEETANLLAGQFGGMRLTMADLLGVAMQSFKELEKIESNTSRTVQRMEALIAKFDAYESGAKSIKVEF